MNFKKDVVLGVLAAGFLIGISVKYLYECYYLGFADFYKAWYYPVLDFVPVLLIGLFALWHALKKFVIVEVDPLNV